MSSQTPDLISREMSGNEVAFGHVPLESDAISVNVVVIVVVVVALAVYAEKANFVNSCVFLVSCFLRFLLPHLIVFPFHISFKNIISKQQHLIP